MRRFSKYEVEVNNLTKSDREFRYRSARYWHGATMEARRTMDRQVYSDPRTELSVLRKNFELYIRTKEAYKNAITFLRTQPKNITPLPG